MPTKTTPSLALGGDVAGVGRVCADRRLVKQTHVPPLSLTHSSSLDLPFSFPFLRSLPSFPPPNLKFLP